MVAFITLINSDSITFPIRRAQTACTGTDEDGDTTQEIQALQSSLSSAPKQEE